LCLLPTTQVRHDMRGASTLPAPLITWAFTLRYRMNCCIECNSALNQLHPLVVPQDSQTKQEPAGRMRTPQVEQKGASTAAIPGVNASSP
jgi:hypothetical protein